MRHPGVSCQRLQLGYEKCLRGLVCLLRPVSTWAQPVLYVLLFFNILFNFWGVQGRKAWCWQPLHPICLLLGNTMPSPAGMVQRRVFWRGSRSHDRCLYTKQSMEDKAELGGCQHRKVYFFSCRVIKSNLQLASSSSSKIHQHCLLLTFLQVVWRKWPGLQSSLFGL